MNNQNCHTVNLVGSHAPLRSFRKNRRSYLLLFIQSSFTTLFNLISHLFIFVATAAAFPLLLVAFVVTRLLQFITHGEAYDKAIRLKSLVRAWVRIGMWLVLLATVIILITLSILKHGANIRHLIHIDINLIISWSKIVCMISGLYFLAFSLTGFMYLLPRIPLEHDDSGIHVPEAISEVIECVIFLWAFNVVIKETPKFLQHKIREFYIRDWIEGPVFVLIAHDMITLSTHMMAWSTRRIVSRHLKPGGDVKSQWYVFVEELMLRKYMVYYVAGTRKSISFILSSLMLLLVWLLYFGSRLNETPKGEDVVELGKWSCFCFVICSLLWLIKACVLLSWEASAVYDRLKSKILKAGEQLYFLGIIGRGNFDIFSLLYDERVKKTEVDEEDIDQIQPTGRILNRPVAQPRSLRGATYVYGSSRYEDNSNTGTNLNWFTRFQLHLVGLYIVSVLGLVSVDKHKSKFDEEEEWKDSGVSSHRLMKMSAKKRKIVKNDLLLKDEGTLTVYDIKQVAQYILAAKDTLSKEKYLSAILQNFRTDEDNREVLKQIINGKRKRSNDMAQNPNNSTSESTTLDDWGYFETLLKDVHPSEEISFLKIQAWMERAHNKCLNLANTLRSAKEVVDCLNKIISGALISLTFIMWLLLTKLATTKVLVLIASPLLAATFIFGDTCKTLFQGVIFIYVVHPFDIGDLCVIGDKLRIVKAIGVWKTIFSKADSIGSREEVIFPNSDLANKMVINHKTEFDWGKWDDYKEFDLGPRDGTNADEVSKLKAALKDHLNKQEEEYKLVQSSHRVAELATKDNIKIAVRLMYKIDSSGDVQDWTYNKCLQQKEEAAAQFDLFMQRLVDKFKGRRANQNYVQSDQGIEIENVK